MATYFGLDIDKSSKMNGPVKVLILWLEFRIREVSGSNNYNHPHKGLSFFAQSL
jgi:hypothetical protein